MRDFPCKRTVFPGSFSRFWGIAGCFLLALMLAACSSSCAPDNEDMKTRSGRLRHNRKEVFKKLTDYSVALIIMTPQRTFLPGSKTAKVIFALKNTGLTPLTVKEWRMCESANLRIRYIAGKPEKVREIPLRQWKLSPTYDTGNKYAEMYNPLILNPQNNNALIEVPLTFIRDVKNLGHRQYFTIVAELNLTSISAKSEPVLVTVK